MIKNIAQHSTIFFFKNIEVLSAAAKNRSLEPAKRIFALSGEVRSQKARVVSGPVRSAWRGVLGGGPDRARQPRKLRQGAGTKKLVPCRSYFLLVCRSIGRRLRFLNGV